MTDREKAGLRGPVRTCVEEAIYPTGTFSITSEYTIDGKLLTSRTTNQDGSEWVTTQTYNADGRLAKIVSGKSGERGSPSKKTGPLGDELSWEQLLSKESLYAYDETGRLLAITDSPQKGSRIDFHYDEQGRKTTIQKFAPEVLKSWQKGVTVDSLSRAAEMGVGVPIGGSVTTIYDDRDQQTEQQIRDAAGNLVTRFVRTYDAQGRVGEEKQILDSPERMFPADIIDKILEASGASREELREHLTKLMGGQAPAGTSYTYDPQNRLTNTRERNMGFEKTTTIIYNDQGDKAEERTTLIGNSVMQIGVVYTMDEKGGLVPTKSATEPPPFPLPVQSVTRYVYQYDGYGNWTQQTASDPSHHDQPSTVRNRKLTYY